MRPPGKNTDSINYYQMKNCISKREEEAVRHTCHSGPFLPGIHLCWVICTVMVLNRIGNLMTRDASWTNCSIKSWALAVMWQSSSPYSLLAALHLCFLAVCLANTLPCPIPHAIDKNLYLGRWKEKKLMKQMSFSSSYQPQYNFFLYFTKSLVQSSMPHF